MKAQVTNNSILQDVTATVAGLVNETRKMISAADVWNIQRQKRTRVQRGFAV